MTNEQMNQMPLALLAECVGFADELSSRMGEESIQLLRTDPNLAEFVAGLLDRRIRIAKLAAALRRKGSDAPPLVVMGGPADA